VFDDATRSLNGLSSLSSNLSQDVKNFNAVVYQINWGMIETSPGVYDWSRIDQALALLKSKGKYLRVRVQDRTFWTGCGSNFIPSWVARDTSYQSANACFAKIWEQATMDQYIALQTALVNRYKSDPSFMGVSTEETAMGATTFQSQPTLVLTGLYPQLERLATAVHTAAPDILFTQYINWPYAVQNSYVAPVVNNLVAFGSGASIGWPDSVVANEYTWPWYQFARDNYTHLVIAPSAEAGTVSAATTVAASLADHEAAYQMLTGDLHANIIVWDTWNGQFGDNYFTQVIIPLVNNHNGTVPNTTCPFK